MSNEDSDVTVCTGPQAPGESPNLENEVTGGAAHDAAGNGIDGPAPLRATMAHLFEVICTQKDEVIREELTAHKHLLNNEIVTNVNVRCRCHRQFEFLKTRGSEKSPRSIGAITKMIQDGTCQCLSPVTKSSCRLLHTAAALGKLWLIDFLLDQGCSIDVYTGYCGYSPLLLGIQNANIEVVQQLVDRGADPNQRPPFNISPVIKALTGRRNIILKALLDTGRIRLDVTHRFDFTALALAITTGNDVAVQRFLEMKADPNAFLADGESMLHLATRMGEFNMVAALIKYGATVDHCDPDGHTALLYAARYGKHECLKILLSHGAYPDEMTPGGNTPLALAAGNTPLALAAQGNQLETLTRLLLEDVNVNNADKNLDTPLHYAAYNGCVESVKLLLERGANPNVINRSKASPLWNAVYKKRLDVVRVLILNNVTLEISSYGNKRVHYYEVDAVRLYSVLWVAVERGCADIVDLLVDAGYNLWKEEWLMQNNEDGLPEESLPILSRLLTLVQQAPSLKFTCRNFLRGRYSLSQLEHLTQISSLPATLEEFLLLTDIRKYACQANAQH